jgi:acetyl-CoA carboxylase carboxyltransferase component
MATGEVVDPEALGGARIHAAVTGLADQIASDEYVPIPSNEKLTKAQRIGLMLSEKLGSGSPPCPSHRQHTQSVNHWHHAIQSMTFFLWSTQISGSPLT